MPTSVQRFFNWPSEVDVDEYDRIVWGLLAFIRGKFEMARHRAATWVPAQMPEGWR